LLKNKIIMLKRIAIFVGFILLFLAACAINYVSLILFNLVGHLVMDPENVTIPIAAGTFYIVLSVALYYGVCAYTSYAF